MSKPVQIFLCHASEDKPKVVEVYRFLYQQGFRPWLVKLWIWTADTSCGA